MKLYYSPAACSLASHIALVETGVPFQVVKVNLRNKTADGGDDFHGINAKGYVPALKLDDGSVLTEGGAILQYVADRKPEAKLAPAWGTMDRYRLQEWLTFIGTEIHKGFSPLWNPNLSEDAKKAAVERLSLRLDWLAKEIGHRQYVMGDTFTVADAYLFTVLNWSAPLKFDLSRWPALQAYHKRIAARASVQTAMKAEGLAA